MAARNFPGPALVLAACLSTAATAAPGEASFGARDPAAIRCSLFTQMNERAPSGTERQFYDWAQGYFAGRSAGAGEGRRLPPDGADRDAAYRRLLDFCTANPAASYADAVLALWTERGAAP